MKKCKALCNVSLELMYRIKNRRYGFVKSKIINIISFYIKNIKQYIIIYTIHIIVIAYLYINFIFLIIIFSMKLYILYIYNIIYIIYYI